MQRKGLGEGEREREDGHREHLVELLEGRLLRLVALDPVARGGDAVERRGARVVLGLDVRPRVDEDADHVRVDEVVGEVEGAAAEERSRASSSSSVAVAEVELARADSMVATSRASGEVERLEVEGGRRGEEGGWISSSPLVSSILLVRLPPRSTVTALFPPSLEVSMASLKLAAAPPPRSTISHPAGCRASRPCPQTSEPSSAFHLEAHEHDREEPVRTLSACSHICPPYQTGWPQRCTDVHRSSSSRGVGLMKGVSIWSIFVSFTYFCVWLIWFSADQVTTGPLTVLCVQLVLLVLGEERVREDLGHGRRPLRRVRLQHDREVPRPRKPIEVADLVVRHLAVGLVERVAEVLRAPGRELEQFGGAADLEVVRLEEEAPGEGRERGEGGVRGGVVNRLVVAENDEEERGVRKRRGDGERENART